MHHLLSLDLNSLLLKWLKPNILKCWYWIYLIKICTQDLLSFEIKIIFSFNVFKTWNYCTAHSNLKDTFSLNQRLCIEFVVHITNSHLSLLSCTHGLCRVLFFFLHIEILIIIIVYGAHMIWVRLRLKKQYELVNFKWKWNNLENAFFSGKCLEVTRY